MQKEDDTVKETKKFPKTWNPIKLVLGDIVHRFDPMFIVLLGMQYFNQGSKVLTSLAMSSLFKDEYGLDPGYSQTLSSIIMLPWAFKIVYGLISDNVPIFGSKRRSYCILLSFMQVVCTILVSFYFGKNEYIPTVLLTITSATIAALDVIVDSIMVI
jgi:hypothetical protein